MTELYPLLTVQNINYWYWEVEPHWSVVDIAKNIGCSRNTVYRYMRHKDIPIRSISEANISRFNCPHKYNNFVKQRQSKEFRESQSIIAYDIMQKPEVRKKYLEAIEKSNEGILSKHQKAILYLLTRHDSLFITELVTLIKGDLNTVDKSIRALYKRQLVNRVKKINPNSFNNYKSHYKYSISKKGKVLIGNKLTKGNQEFMELLRDNVREKKDKEILQQEFIKRENIGKNQLIILKTIQKEGSKFFSDLVSLTGLPKGAIDSGLRGLSSRGFLYKEKKVNPNYQEVDKKRRYYWYSITDKCPKLN
jgi:DNA-binding MarR family transcriptional regulator